MGLRSATQAGWLNDWLHSGGLAEGSERDRGRERRREWTESRNMTEVDKTSGFSSELES